MSAAPSIFEIAIVKKFPIQQMEGKYTQAQKKIFKSLIFQPKHYTIKTLPMNQFA